MNEIRRIGNFGVANTNAGLMSFSVGATFQGFEGAAMYNFTVPNSWYDQRMQIGGYEIIPLGYNNDLPLEIQRILDESYSGEGILGKIQGLQWGEGPRQYEEVYTPEGDIVMKWVKDQEVADWLDSFDGINEILKCHIDLTHGLGFFYKMFRNRGVRIGNKPFIAEIKHIAVDKARLEYPGDYMDYPQRIITGHFPNVRIDKMAAYPIWDKNNPFANAVSMGYQNLYSFCKAFYQTPRYLGALGWMKLANGIAPLLTSYNANASAISYHIESPEEYWLDAKAKLEENCKLKGIPYEDKMLEDFKDKAFENFTSALTGTENVGKFLHTQEFYNEVARSYQGWKVTPIDKKIKDYIDAQIAIANKADSASTSGFGLSPSLSNIIVDGKMNSGSEMLYALKGYFATETAVPEMILMKPWNDAIKVNFPDKNVKLGFFRRIVMKEDMVKPADRIVSNA
jgi:hypothetical protein